MKEQKVSRRDFLKTTGAGTAALTTVAPSLTSTASAAAIDRHAVIAALGDTMIPTDPGDPGYSALEPYKITDEVMKGLTGISDDDLTLFNSKATEFFNGKSFLELQEPQRADYLRLIIDGSKVTDKQALAKLQSVYRLTRVRVLVVFYQNFPEHRIQRDANDIPILPPGDTHQITNPNTKQLVTGWDIAGFHGPLTREEEERRRAKYKQLDWQE